MSLSGAIASCAVPRSLYVPTSKWINQALDPTSALSSEVAAGPLIEQIRNSEPRYQFFPDAPTDREKLLIYLFRRSISDQGASAVIESLERRERVSFYPKWKTVCFINLRRFTAGFIDCLLVRIPTYVIVFVYAKNFFWKMFSRIENLVVEAKISAALFALSTVSPEVLQLRNAVVSVVRGFYSYRWSIVISLFFIRSVFSRFAFTRPIANRITFDFVSNVFFNSGRSVWSFVWGTSWQAATGFKTILDCSSSFLRDFATYSEQARCQEKKRHAPAVWLRIVRASLPAPG